MAQNRKQSTLGFYRKQTRKWTLYQRRGWEKVLGGIVGFFLSFLFIFFIKYVYVYTCMHMHVYAYVCIWVCIYVGFMYACKASISPPWHVHIRVCVSGG